MLERKGIKENWLHLIDKNSHQYTFLTAAGCPRKDFYNPSTGPTLKKLTFELQQKLAFRTLSQLLAHFLSLWQTDIFSQLLTQFLNFLSTF